MRQRGLYFKTLPFKIDQILVYFTLYLSDIFHVKEL